MQEEQLTPCEGNEPCSRIEGYCEYCEVGHAVHKQSLINLKEYMEDDKQLFIKTSLFQFAHLKEKQIKELTKLIERYE